MFNQIKLYLRIVGEGAHCLMERMLHPRAVYLIFTPEHGNLGDHAIAQAETELFSRKGIKFIEVSYNVIKRRRELGGLTRLMNGRTILVHGGGFLGTLWFPCELLLRDVIKQNRRSQIILLPNTVYYEDSPKGREELEKSTTIYNAHKNLTIYTRERTSFDLVKDLYRDVRLMPDMVMYMNKSNFTSNRSGCILCLRSDHERTRTQEDDQIIVNQATSLFGSMVSYRDMCIDHAIADRDQELDRQYDAFRKAELVITDRLHGMIFCAITGTPCIVLDSKSPKVKGCYEWIKHLEYIRFCDNVEDIAQLYEAIPKKQFEYDNSRLTRFFDNLADEIEERR